MEHKMNLPFMARGLVYEQLSPDNLEQAAQFAGKIGLKQEPLASGLELRESDLIDFLLNYSDAIYHQGLCLVVRDICTKRVVGVSYIHDYFTHDLPKLSYANMQPLAELKEELVSKFHIYLESNLSGNKAIAEWMLLAIDPQYQNQGIIELIADLSRYLLTEAGYEGLMIFLSSPISQHVVEKECYSSLARTFKAEIELDTYIHNNQYIFKNINDRLPQECRWRNNRPVCQLVYLSLHEQSSLTESGAMVQYKNIIEKVKSQKHMMLGKPGNMDFDFTPLAEVLQVFINNSGHPFAPSSHRLDVKEMEKKLIHFFSSAYGLSKDDAFGYVTSGGSEALEYGLWTGFKKLKNPIVLLSEETHYIAFTILKKFNRPYEVVPCSPNGEVDYKQLQSMVDKLDQPVIFLANIGSTMKGAIDDVTIVKQILAKHHHYIHADAALHGAFLAFLPKIYQNYQLDLVSNIDSLSISLHKFLGNLTPAGLVITAKKNLHQEDYIEYIASENQTLTCSRSGLAVLLASYRLDILGGASGLAEMATRCINLASYLLSKLECLSVEARLNQSSNIVYFPSLAQPIAQKWMLPNSKGVSHVVVMPHVSKALLDEFLADISRYQDQ